MATPITSEPQTAAARYAARVEAALAQRTRLRGTPPTGDLFAGLPAEHPLLTSDPHRPLDPNLEVLAAYLTPDDVLVDVGGGGGRISLPLALRCRELVNVDPSPTMGAAFLKTAAQAGITNVRFIEGDWLGAEDVVGDVALLNQVVYLTADILPFVEKLERTGRRRVLITVDVPPPPAWHRELFALIHGEPEVVVPGHVELVNVLWELGVLPDVRVLPNPTGAAFPPVTTRAAAVQEAALRALREQWAIWPAAPELEARARQVVEARFDDLFAQGPQGPVPRWLTPGREVLITWQPGVDRQAR